MHNTHNCWKFHHPENKPNYSEKMDSRSIVDGICAAKNLISKYPLNTDNKVTLANIFSSSCLCTLLKTAIQWNSLFYCFTEFSHILEILLKKCQITETYCKTWRV